LNRFGANGTLHVHFGESCEDRTIRHQLRIGTNGRIVEDLRALSECSAWIWIHGSQPVRLLSDPTTLRTGGVHDGVAVRPPGEDCELQRTVQTLERMNEDSLALLHRSEGGHGWEQARGVDLDDLGLKVMPLCHDGSLTLRGGDSTAAARDGASPGNRRSS